MSMVISKGKCNVRGKDRREKQGAGVMMLVLRKTAVADNVNYGKRLIKVEDFNYKEVCWEEWMSEGGVRLWGSDDPSRLYLVFVREPKIVEKMLHKSLLEGVLMWLLS